MFIIDTDKGFCMDWGVLKGGNPLEILICFSGVHHTVWVNYWIQWRILIITIIINNNVFLMDEMVFEFINNLFVYWNL